MWTLYNEGPRTIYFIEDKIKTLSPHLLMAYSGEPGALHILQAHPH